VTGILVYIVKQIIPWVILTMAALALLFLTSQLLRVAPVFVGAGVSMGEGLTAIGLLLVPVFSWSLTPAFALAVFAAAGRLSRDGELTAFHAAGLSRYELSKGPVALALVLTMLSAWLWLVAAPAAQAALRKTAINLAGRALTGRIQPGIFAEPLEGLTFFADRRTTKSTFQGVFVEDARNPNKTIQFVASEAHIHMDPSTDRMALNLKKGRAFFSENNLDRLQATLSFERFSFPVSLVEELENRLDFLPKLLAASTTHLTSPPPPGTNEVEWQFALWRRIAGPLGFLSLALLSITLSFATNFKNQPMAICLAAILFLAYHLLGRLGESLMQGGNMGGIAAALLPVCAVFPFLFPLLAHSYKFR
jgi:lipopolysaccharide export system permease protein